MERVENICTEYSKVRDDAPENPADDEVWHSEPVLKLENQTLIAYCGSVRYKYRNSIGGLNFQDFL